ncbi:hypothetical protein GCM10027275_03280 [Rhabdobacter roseus]|uniref:Peptidase M56 domain-containing protein n=1 Tax=Rhabdobacter roseus TaxID=1655419 RepID=A0A840TDN2_9BACT|nr:M56 family metallopeptidase [Rhabdobacter roseus]MBB5282216.1 hypothetical protein [Rhabdobacter roseus]
MDYLLKASACLVGFYGLYYLLLRPLTFHTWNRYYLLAALGLGLFIPLTTFESTQTVVLPPKSAPLPEVSSIGTLSPAETALKVPSSTSEKVPEALSWLEILSLMYLLGVLGMALRLLFSLWKVAYSSRQAQKAGTYWLVPTAGRLANSSFFHFIFLDKSLSGTERQWVLQHEQYHAKRRHSLDLLVLEVIKVVFWFNPVVWLYQKSLRDLHEYEVDALMIQQYDRQQYAHLLLNLALDKTPFSVHAFSQKPLTNRIYHLFKKPSPIMKKLLYFLALPLVAGGVLAFAQQRVKVEYQAAAPQPDVAVEAPKVPAYPLKVYNTNTNWRGIWSFTAKNLELNNLTILPAGANYNVNPNSLTLASIEEVNRKIKHTGVEIVVSDLAYNADGSTSQIGLSIRDHRIKKTTPPEVIPMNEARALGAKGAFINFDMFAVSRQKHGVYFEQGDSELEVVSSSRKLDEMQVPFKLNTPSVLAISQDYFQYRANPDQIRETIVPRANAFLEKEGFRLDLQKVQKQGDSLLVSCEVVVEDLQKGTLVRKAIQLDDHRKYLYFSKTGPVRWDDTFYVKINRATRDIQVLVDEQHTASTAKKFKVRSFSQLKNEK